MGLKSILKKSPGNDDDDDGEVTVTVEEQNKAKDMMNTMTIPLAKQSDIILSRKRKEKKRKSKLGRYDAAYQADTSSKKMKQESEEQPKDENAEALEYLRKWKKDRQNWKFQKKKQVVSKLPQVSDFSSYLLWLVHQYLLRHIYNPAKIDRRRFKWLVKYLEGLKGAAREHSHAYAKRAVEDKDFRTGIMKAFGDSTDGKDSDSDGDNAADELCDEIERRAVKLLSALG